MPHDYPDVKSEKVDSLKKRYAYKLLLGLSSPLLGVITNTIVPRSLGPSAYGNYTFLQSLFTSAIGLLESGSSICFYTKLSKKPNDSYLLGFYLFTVIAFALVLSLSVFGLYLTNWGPIFWHENHISIVSIMAGVCFFIWFSDIIIKISDAKGLTVKSEIARLIHKFCLIIVLIALSVSSSLTLVSFGMVQFASGISLCILIWYVIKKSDPSPILFSKSKNKIFTKDFYQFVSPIFFYNCLSQGAPAFEAWLLLKFGGNIEQGYFGFSYQVCIVAFIFTNAMIPLTLREFSQAIIRNDYIKLNALFGQSLKILYGISIAISGFLFFQMDRITYLLAGKDFEKAAIPVAIMILYPAHQTYGQITNSLFFALEKTKTYRNLGYLSIFLSLSLTFILLAPNEMGGFALGATGQAIKFVFVQIIITNIALYYCVKYFKSNYFSYIKHQMSTTILALALGAGVRFAIDSMFFAQTFFEKFLIICLSGTLYTLFFIAILVYIPEFFGLTSSQIKTLFLQIKYKLNSWRKHAS